MTKQIAVRLPEAINTHLDELEKQFLSDRIVKWLTDSDSPWALRGEAFDAECRRQSQALVGDPLEAEILGELESNLETTEWQ